MKSEHESKPQNPLLVNVLYKQKVLESWGRGIGLMMSECRKAGLPEPEYKIWADNAASRCVWPAASKEMHIEKLCRLVGFDERQTETLVKVNQVWLPEIQKWAMLDSDMRAWAEDENGTPLSLAEMRERYINGQEIIYRPLLDSENNFNYYKMYWAKNLYWFISWEVTGYSREDNNPAFSNHDREIILVPKGFSGFDLSDKSVLTTDESRFWAVPDSLTVSL